MALYRKRPVVIEAEQFFCRNRTHPAGVLYDSVLGYHIQTLEGSLHVSNKDWIITGVSGERYPCKPDIFAATYEPCDSDILTPLTPAPENS